MRVNEVTTENSHKRVEAMSVLFYNDSVCCVNSYIILIGSPLSLSPGCRSGSPQAQHPGAGIQE